MKKIVKLETPKRRTEEIFDGQRGSLISLFRDQTREIGLVTKSQQRSTKSFEATLVASAYWNIPKLRASLGSQISITALCLRWSFERTVALGVELEETTTSLSGQSFHLRPRLPLSKERSDPGGEGSNLTVQKCYHTMRRWWDLSLRSCRNTWKL